MELLTTDLKLQGSNPPTACTKKEIAKKISLKVASGWSEAGGTIDYRS